MDEPKKETVRIALPPRSGQAAPAPNVANRDPARIVLPSRTPVTPVRRLPPKITPLPASEETASAAEAPRIGPRRPPVAPPSSNSPLLQPLPKPPGIQPNPERNPAIRPEPPPVREDNGAPSLNRDPKRETARISILPRPIPMAGPVVITSRPVAPVDAIPRSLVWTVFAIAVVIFLIQIWNYVVS